MSWQKNRLLERVPAFSCVTRTFVPLCRPFDDLQRASVLRVTTCVCRNEFMRMGVHTLRIHLRQYIQWSVANST